MYATVRNTYNSIDPNQIKSGHDHPNSLVSSPKCWFDQGLKLGCMDQPSPLVWVIFGLSNAADR